MTEFRTVPCKFCHEPIVWCEETPNPNARRPAAPKRLPMDAEPNDHALHTITPNSPGYPRVATFRTRNQAAGARAAGVRTYQQHSKTCAKIEKWPKGQYLAKLRTRS